MTDITTEARAWARNCDDTGLQYTAALLRRLADEIERLRASPADVVAVDASIEQAHSRIRETTRAYFSQCPECGGHAGTHFDSCESAAP